MDNYFSNPMTFLVEVIFGLYTLVVMLRFLLQVVKADFYNPLSQFIVKATTPVLNPLRRIIPSIAGMDTASLVLAWLVKSLQWILILVIAGAADRWASAFILAIPDLVSLTIDIFLYAILIQVILSWVAPHGHNPATSILYSLTEPLLGPARRRIPPMGGLDLSPMVVMVVLVLLKMLIVPPIRAALGALV